MGNTTPSKGCFSAAVSLFQQCNNFIWFQPQAEEVDALVNSESHFSWEHFSKDCSTFNLSCLTWTLNHCTLRSCRLKVCPEWAKDFHSSLSCLLEWIWNKMSPGQHLQVPGEGNHHTQTTPKQRAGRTGSRNRCWSCSVSLAFCFLIFWESCLKIESSSNSNFGGFLCFC